MGQINANYSVIQLSGTKTLYELGDGISASTVHEIFCVSGGTIAITPMHGNEFIWGATAGQNMHITPRQTVLTSGLFLGFKAKFTPSQYTTGRLV